jgi:uncharacterized membrane protein YbaN (DUF454 family)
MNPGSIRRGLLVGFGVLNVGLGVLGILLPLLPTTPFLLLAAYLFARSSRRWHDWLLAHPHLGPYIHAFRHRQGLTVSQKVRLGASMTVIMAVSAYFAPIAGVRIALGILWLFWVAMLLRMRTRPAAATSD